VTNTFRLETVLADSHAIDVFLEKALAYSGVFARRFVEPLTLQMPPSAV
jgi:hypothetical protein